jgi:hypothetical protein
MGFQQSRIVNNATAGAVAAGSTMAEIYKSKWLRDKEATLAADLTRFENFETAPATTIQVRGIWMGVSPLALGYGHSSSG